MTGVIYKALAGFYYVEAGGESVTCRARGVFRREGVTPLVGDLAELELSAPGVGTVTGILPRRNAFTRPPIANLDAMVVVASAAIPETDPYLIDRMAAIACRNDCECIICINKVDMDYADRLYEIYSLSGFCTVRVSALTGEGIGELRDAIRGKISAFTGNSGVGKSSILNALGYGLDISVGEVSEKLGRGRHTTRHTELYRLPGETKIADTPGFSSFDTGKMDLTEKKEIQFAFQEFAPYLGRCRFDDCVHLKEPGCAVTDAAARGEIQPSRHGSYARLCAAADELHAREYK
ncbi:MAG: ribosome small subunit-dependent GTPase A [Oscillospiraceae bacterium]|jgi:ribosome biogenesis GTPase|nr:ribosome small subunit-dependent GTPase A [Oscillospiraceae bacterium]